jgi:hypothetical protein
MSLQEELKGPPPAFALEHRAKAEPATPLRSEGERHFQLFYRPSKGYRLAGQLIPNG